MKQRKFLAFVLLACGAGARAQTPATFLEPRHFGSGTAQAIAIGDFNRDGAQDAATVGPELTIYLGDGHGSFTAMPAIGISGFAIVTADFNGDGAPDLAVAGASGLLVLLGNGDGTFRAPVPYPAVLSGLATGDFNGDGIADIAAVGNQQVQVFFGSASGALQAGPITSSVCTASPSASLSADFNGDGKVDLATTCAYEVNVLFGHGDGTFAKPIQYKVAEFSVSALVGADFNGDGALDLACAGGTEVSVLLNNGKGKFTVSAPIKFRQTLNTLAVADWNGDGIPDLLAGGTGIAAVLPGRGDGSFAYGQQYVLAYAANALAVADFNGDGVPDVASANGPATYTSAPPQPPFTVMLGAGHGKFQSSRAFDAASVPNGIAVGDFNHDGNPDVAISNYSGVYDSPSTIAVLLGDGKGGLGIPASYPADKPVAIAVGDVNSDGNPDLVFFGDNGGVVGTLPGNGDGTFAAAVYSPCGCTAGLGTSLVLADFNGDGKLDVAVTSGGGVAILLGNGNGTFQHPMFFGLVDPLAIAVADFNNDGHPDLLLSGTSVDIILGNGDGTFGDPILVNDSGLYAGTGDFNSDGNADIALALNDGYGVAIYLGHGNGTFTPAFTIDAAVNGGPFLVGDFNGDGIPALFFSGGAQPTETDGLSTILLGLGDGNFTIEKQQYLIFATYEFLNFATGDFNRDGKLDVASVGADYAVWILLNTTGH
jgi:hypothetical protein